MGLGARTTSALRRHSWLIKPFLTLLAACLLLWVCYRLFLAADPSSFARELVSAAVGAVATLIGVGIVAVIALGSRLRTYLDKERVRRFEDDTWYSSSIRAGNMDIPHLAVVASCTQGVGWTERVTVEFKDASPRDLDPLVGEARELWLPQLLSRAGSDYVLVDAPRMDLVDADLRVEHQRGQRRPHYTLSVSPSTYFDFACSNSRLDEPLKLPQETQSRSLRQRWGVHPRSILDVGMLPTSAPMGSGTVVVTSDQRVILAIRHRTFMAGAHSTQDTRKPVHFVAEGLLPEDRDDDGQFSPSAGALRGLREELHIGRRSEHIAGVDSLTSTGFSFDQLRWQPYFTFLATLDRTWDEVQTAAPAASDAWEAEALISLPFDIEHAGVRSLLLGRHPDLVLASNHASAALWFALLYQHGYQQMRDELT